MTAQQAETEWQMVGFFGRRLSEAEQQAAREVVTESAWSGRYVAKNVGDTMITSNDGDGTVNVWRKSIFTSHVDVKPKRFWGR